jgi:hypothetical protein
MSSSSTPSAWTSTFVILAWISCEAGMVWSLPDKVLIAASAFYWSCKRRGLRSRRLRSRSHCEVFILSVVDPFVSVRADRFSERHSHRPFGKEVLTCYRLLR